MDYEQTGQFFRNKVLEIADFVNNKMTIYRTSRSGTLHLDRFRIRFLQEIDLIEVIYYFVYSVFRLKRFEDLDSELMKNAYSSLLQLSLLSDICLVIDNTILNKKLNKKEYRFIDHLVFISQKESLNLSIDNAKDFNNNMNMDFAGTIDKILTSNYTFKDSTKPTPIEEDLLLAYGIRNHSAHRLEEQIIIHNNFERLSQRLLNALFYVVEKLY